MAKEDRGHVFYYQDELNDDFEKTKTLKRIDLPEGYKRIHTNPFFKAFSFWIYWLVAKPVLHIICFFAGIKVKGRENIKKVKKAGQAAFIYMNHTSFWDMIINQVSVVTRKRCNIIGYTDALTLPKPIKLIVEGLGFIALPSSVSDYRKFSEALEYYQKKKRFTVIFPEAHVWPYYTKIRPFISTSFKYPAKLNAPIVPVVSCFTKKKFSDKPKITIYIGEAIYPKKELSVNENKEYLRNECYKWMSETAEKYSTYNYYVYKKKEDDLDESKEEKI